MSSSTDSDQRLCRSSRAGTTSGTSGRWPPGLPGTAPCASSPTTRPHSRRLATLESAADFPPPRGPSIGSSRPSDPDRAPAGTPGSAAATSTTWRIAADTFAAPRDDDPADAPAWYNHALCLAWLGENAEAVDSLDRVVRARGGGRFDLAVDAWTLAEVLRHGGRGRARWPMTCATPGSSNGPATTSPNSPTTGPGSSPSRLRRSTRPPACQRSPRPRSSSGSTARCPDSAREVRSGADLPQSPGQVFRTHRTLRLSSPDPQTLDAIHDRLSEADRCRSRAFRREASPLALPFLDAAVWTFRGPAESTARLNSRSRARGRRALLRESLDPPAAPGPGQPLAPRRLPARPRRATPARAASSPPSSGSANSSAPGLRTAELYQGYPFDRLRRRLGLEPDDPAAIDRDDLTCAGEAELDRLDPTTLDDVSV